MLVRCVVVGIDDWETLTRPFVEGLKEENPLLDLVVIDNASKDPYPVSDKFDMIRTLRTGYGEALNTGAADADWDWLLCCNNDCLCEGDVFGPISRLHTDTIYGNDWKFDYSGQERGLPAVADSAYLLIPRMVWDAVGKFDPGMDAAFEEIDLQIRALDSGFRVNIAELPITHLNMHTRYELADYRARWEKTEQYFLSKYPGRVR